MDLLNLSKLAVHLTFFCTGSTFGSQQYLISPRDEKHNQPCLIHVRICVSSTLLHFFHDAKDNCPSLCVLIIMQLCICVSQLENLFLFTKLAHQLRKILQTDAFYICIFFSVFPLNVTFDECVIISFWLKGESASQKCLREQLDTSQKKIIMVWPERQQWNPTQRCGSFLSTIVICLPFLVPCWISLHGLYEFYWKYSEGPRQILNMWKLHTSPCAKPNLQRNYRAINLNY